MEIHAHCYFSSCGIQSSIKWIIILILSLYLLLLPHNDSPFSIFINHGIICKFSSGSGYIFVRKGKKRVNVNFHDSFHFLCSTKMILYKAHIKPLQICCSVLLYSLFSFQCFSTIHIHTSTNEILNGDPISSCWSQNGKRAFPPLLKKLL